MERKRDREERLAEARDLHYRALEAFQEERYGESRRLLEESRDIRKEEKDYKGLTQAYALEGDLALVEKRVEEAQNHYQKGLILSREHGVREGEATLSWKMGQFLIQAGAVGDGLLLLKSGVSIFEEQGYPDMDSLRGEIGEYFRKLPQQLQEMLARDDLSELDRAFFIYQRALLAMAQGETAAALNDLETSWKINIKEGRLEGILAGLNSLDELKRRCEIPQSLLELEKNARAWLEKHNESQAQDSVQENLLLNLLEQHRESGAKGGQERVLHGLADTCLHQGEAKKAIDYLQEAITLSESMEEQGGLIISYSLMGDALLAQNNRTEALKSFMAGLDLARKQGSRDSEGALMVKVGQLIVMGGQPGQGVLLMSRGGELLEEIGDKRSDQVKATTAELAERGLRELRDKLSTLEEKAPRALYQHEHALLLQALGRLEEAMEPLKESLTINIEEEHLEGVKACLFLAGRLREAGAEMSPLEDLVDRGQAWIAHLQE